MNATSENPDIEEGRAASGMKTIDKATTDGARAVLHFRDVELDAVTVCAIGVRAGFPAFDVF
jgi:hypothetical protein